MTVRARTTAVLVLALAFAGCTSGGTPTGGGTGGGGASPSGTGAPGATTGPTGYETDGGVALRSPPTSTPRPGDPGVAVEPTPPPAGVYRYRGRSEGRSVADGVQEAAQDWTLSEPTRAGSGWVQTTRVAGPTDPTRYNEHTIRWVRRGTRVLERSEHRPAGERRCELEPPVEQFRFPIRLGEAWTTETRCEGDDQVTENSFQWLRRETVEIGGVRVNAFVIDELRRVRSSRVGASLQQVRYWFSPEHRLIVRVESGTQGSAFYSYLVLQDLRPS